MSFFTSADITLGTKLLEVVYIVMGLITIYTGVKNARDKENPSRVGTAVFWCALGIVLAFGRWIPAMIDGLSLIHIYSRSFKRRDYHLCDQRRGAADQRERTSGRGPSFTGCF